MSPYFISWVGPLLFMATWIIQVLHRGHVTWVADAVILTCFLLQSFKPLHKLLNPLSLIAVYGCIGALSGFHDLLYTLSFCLASQLTFYGAKIFNDKLLQHKKNETSCLFYEKLLLKNLQEIARLKQKLETLIEQPLEDYPSSCDRIEPIEFVTLDEDVGLQLAVIEEKKPLRRLRKIVVKRPGLFD